MRRETRVDVNCGLNKGTPALPRAQWYRELTCLFRPRHRYSVLVGPYVLSSKNSAAVAMHQKQDFDGKLDNSKAVVVSEFINVGAGTDIDRRS